MRFLLLFFLTTQVHAYALMGFQTDYCTMFKEGTRKNPEAWKDCCLEHDLYYWAGGTMADRNRADLRLKECVREKGYPGYAIEIYSGVRLGHFSPIKSAFPWNNGWLGKHKPLPLTANERQEVEMTVVTFSYPEEVVKLFLENF